ncbi:MAG TPA: dienelactone hydrolase family protein [Acidimicrobiales bacterium]|jgi:carboxymethylenebutenolidase|nr:dienelactone hydrolase family protein [Acidimicrobiales bacterium]
MPVDTEETTAGPLRAYVARPPGPGPHPGVLVLHELFGLNDDIRRIARRFAGNGYVALAPDLFSHGPKAVCLSRVLMDLGRGAGGRTLDDVLAARRALADRPDVDAGRVAVAGFCMGGSFALVVGVKGDVQASAVNYGAVPKARGELDGVCPVVASFGAQDRIFAKQGERLKQHLEALDVPHDYKLYEHVGHSFFNQDNGPAWMLRMPSPMSVGYSEAAAEDGWARMLGFFKQYV